MGTCKYCGQSAGWFHSKHDACEAKHAQGVSDFRATLKSYFAGRVTSAEITRARQRNQANAFLSKDDVCEASAQEIRAYAASIHRPFSPQSMKVMDDFLNVIGPTYSEINKSGAVDEFTKKLMRGFMADYFTDQLTLQVAHQRCEKVLSHYPMTLANIEDAYLYVLNKAATNLIQPDGTISSDDQLKIDEYVNYLSLPVNNLPAKYANSEISKLSQISILSSLQRGVVPSAKNIGAPIVLSRGESIIWSYDGVSMYQEKTVKEYGGRRSGWSFRVMKGVTYHTGGTKIQPIEHTYMDFKGHGKLYITSKHLVFQGDTAAVKIAYDKLIGLTPYSDGIEVHRDGANAKRLTFQGFDSWFVMNVVSIIANM